MRQFENKIMEYILHGTREALKIIVTFDREFLKIVFVSIKCAGASTLLASLVGVPLGMFIAQKRFFGRSLVVTLINTLMSLPTVVIGLVLYSFFSRKGPLGNYELLFTQTAIIIGQFILILPIISGLTISAIKSMDPRIKITLTSLGADKYQNFIMFLHEARYAIFAAVIAGFGRVFAEVGISMMLGGNIKGYTRNITTAIALETSKGEFALGIALGIVLLMVAFIINVLFAKMQKRVCYERV